MSVGYNIVIFAILSNKPILLNNITRLERGSAGFIWKVAFRAACSFFDLKISARSAIKNFRVFFFDLGNFSRCVVSRGYAQKLPKNPEAHSMRDV